MKNAQNKKNQISKNKENKNPNKADNKIKEIKIKIEKKNDIKKIFLPTRKNNNIIKKSNIKENIYNSSEINNESNKKFIFLPKKTSSINEPQFKYNIKTERNHLKR